MKSITFLILILVVFVCLILISSCFPDGTGYECSQGVCISITYEGPAQVMVPVMFKVSVITDKDIKDLGISVTGHLNVSIQDAIGQPDGVVINYQDDQHIGWRLNTKGGEEYIFTGYLVLEKKEHSYRLSGYEVTAVASLYSGFRVTDSFHIYLDAAGNQMDESEAKLLMETDLPLPTLDPSVTVFPDTPFPTIIWPTDTTISSPTPTLLPYP